VAEALPLSEGELELLDSLVRHKVRFMVVGLSAAALQGAPVVTEDVDLWFEDLNSPQLTSALKAVGAAYVPPFGNNPPMLAGQHADPFDIVLRMDGLKSFQEEAKNTKNVRLGKLRVSVLSLERIFESKKAANRPKDRAVLVLLGNTLAAVKSGKRKSASRRSKSRSRPKRRSKPRG
jgi:hypothetical protein